MMAQGEFALVEERLEASLALSGQPVKRGTMAHEHIVYMMLVEAACMAENLEAIEKYNPYLESLARRDDHEPYLAASRRAEGLACRLRGDWERAASALNEAGAYFSDQNMHWQFGRTLCELAKLEKAQDSIDTAIEYFHRAMESFEIVGARPDYGRAKAAMEGLIGAV